MKKVYLVKKNPEIPAGEENWIIMDGSEFSVFIRTPEGQRRASSFGKLYGCDAKDVMFIAECGEEKAEEWNRDVERNKYVQFLDEDIGYAVYSYHGIRTMEGTDLIGEELIKDESENVEEAAMARIMKENLRAAILTLPESDRDLIDNLFLCEHPLTETEYARLIGSTRDQVHERKRTILRRMRAMLEDE